MTTLSRFQKKKRTHEEAGRLSHTENPQPATQIYMLRPDQVRLNLARQLADLANKDSTNTMLAAGVHHLLVQLLRGGPNLSTTAIALGAIRRMVTPDGRYEAERCKAMDDALSSSIASVESVRDVISSVVPLLGASNPMVAKNATIILYELSNHEAGGDEHRGEIRDEICRAGAIPALLARIDLATTTSHTVRLEAVHALGMLVLWAPAAAAVASADGIGPLLALLYARPPDVCDRMVEVAVTSLENILKGADEQQIRSALAVLVDRPPLPDNVNGINAMLAYLAPAATEALTAAEAGNDVAALQAAVNLAAVVRVADDRLQRARATLAARRARRASLGLDELKTPDEFDCPITHDVMQDPVCASDGHTYERAAIERVLALPVARRKSPLTRATLSAALYPNIALRKRIAAHHQDMEAVAETAAQRAVAAAAKEQADRDEQAAERERVVELEPAPQPSPEADLRLLRPPTWYATVDKKGMDGDDDSDIRQPGWWRMIYTEYNLRWTEHMKSLPVTTWDESRDALLPPGWRSNYADGTWSYYGPDFFSFGDSFGGVPFHTRVAYVKHAWCLHWWDEDSSHWSGYDHPNPNKRMRR